MHPAPESFAGSLVAALDRLPRSGLLTQAEREEVLRIARGFAAKESAAAADVSPHTIRGRRQHIYLKLRVASATELMGVILASALEARRGALDPGDEAAAESLDGTAVDG